MGFLNIFNKRQQMSNTQKLFNGIQSQMMLLPPDLNTQAYLNLYGEVGYIFACINTRANAIADTEWYAEDKKGNKKEKSMALELLKKPNPFTSQYELFSMTSKYLDTVGQAFWYIAKDGKYGLPREIWCINPAYMYIVPDKNNYIKGYVYRCGADNIPLNCDDVLMFSNSNPGNSYAGVSPLKALASIVETEKFSNEYNRNFFYNNATPNGIITYEKTLTDAQFERIKDQWNGNYGGITNSHKMAILEGNAKYQSTGMSQKDMDFAVMKGLNKKEILAVFSTPEILITGEAVNRGTAEVQEAIFYKNAIRPILRLIKDKLNNEFIPLFKIETDVELKYLEVLSEDKEFIKSILDSQVNKTISVNEARKVLSRLIGEELKKVEGGDEIMTSPMTVPLSIASDYISTDTASSTPGNVPQTEEVKSFKKKDFKAVNKALKNSAGKYQNEMMKASMKIEKEFIKDLNQFFSKQLDEIAEDISAGKPLNDLEDRYNSKLENIARKHIDNAFKVGGKTSANTTKAIAGAINKDVIDNLVYTHATNIIEEAVLKRISLIKRVNEATTLTALKIADELYKENKLSIKEVKNRLVETGMFSKNRSRTIAQTETLGAMNEASYLMMKQNEDIVGYKAWISNTDKEVRDAHAEAGFTYSIDNPIPVDDYFIVWGEQALHPLDSNMSAQNIINCRCCMMPLLKE